MKRVVLILLATVALAAACATFSPPAASQCGNPCANVTCPSAFACVVDARCVARCQAEAFKPGVP